MTDYHRFLWMGREYVKMRLRFVIVQRVWQQADITRHKLPLVFIATGSSRC